MCVEESNSSDFRINLENKKNRLTALWTFFFLLLLLLFFFFFFFFFVFFFFFSLFCFLFFCCCFFCCFFYVFFFLFFFQKTLTKIGKPRTTPDDRPPARRDIAILKDGYLKKKKKTSKNGNQYRSFH